MWSDEKLFVSVDYQVAVSALHIGELVSNLSQACNFHGTVRKVDAEVSWFPGHSKFSGNEEVNAGARSAL